MPRRSLLDVIHWKQTFSALKHPNYRLWFWGQLISLFGTWMQTTAQGFLVFELTHSPVYLGYVGFATGLPTWLFTLYGGVVADRFSRRTMMLVTQTAMMLLAFLLATFTFLQIVQPWQILIFAFALGVANAFDAPARQAFVIELVEREDLSNAVALNSAIFQAATVVGPAASGIIYALFGPAWCFVANGISFIAVIAGLVLMKVKSNVREQRESSTFSDIKEGLHYALTHRTIRTLLLLVAAASWFVISLTALIPAWAVKVLGGHAGTNGVLLSARGLGSLVGVLIIASLSRFEFKGKLLSWGTFVAPFFLLLFAFVRWLPLSIVVLFAVGLALIFVLNLSNALVQSLVPDELRGRVMGVYSLTFFGFMPVGALWIGAMAERFGEPEAVIINAMICLAIAAIVWKRIPELRLQR